MSPTELIDALEARAKAEDGLMLTEVEREAITRHWPWSWLVTTTLGRYFLTYSMVVLECEKFREAMVMRVTQDLAGEP